jgi:hypothetical protein
VPPENLRAKIVRIAHKQWQLIDQRNDST